MIFFPVKLYKIYQEINNTRKEYRKIRRKIFDFMHNQARKFVSITGGLEMKKAWG